MTLDLDCADIRADPPGSRAGLWVLRPATQSLRAVTALVVSGLRLAAVERVQGQLWVIDEAQVRIRDS